MLITSTLFLRNHNILIYVRLQQFAYDIQDTLIIFHISRLKLWLLGT